MIEEQSVSFDTAKLLKEAGFNVSCRYSYDNIGGFRWLKIREPTPKEWVPCPTQALAARWLCEHKMIEVSTAYCRQRKSWYYQVGYLDCKDEDMTFGFNYASRQYAMEAGLREAIKLIKKQ